MGATSFNEYQMQEANGSRELRLRGYNVKVNEFMIGNYLPNAAFIANPIDTAFVEGLSYNPIDFYAWASSNGFKVYEQGVDLQGPVLLTSTINGGKTVVTLTFDGKVNKVSDATALKAAITFASNGTTFAALGGSDSVGTVDGTGNTIVITFNSALTTATNKIKIAAGAIKDASGNINLAAITTPSIDVKLPVATFVPANSATGVSRTGNIVITLDEKVFNADGSDIQDSDLAAKLVLKLTDAAGANVAFTATINAAKTIITVDPTTTLAATTIHYAALSVGTVQDASGNENALTAVTFTTGS